MFGEAWPVRRFVICLVVAAAAACSTTAPTGKPSSQSAYLASWSAINKGDAQAATEETYRRSLELLNAPPFRTLPASMQHQLLLSTAEMGMQRRDYAGAHELAVRASSMAGAGVADWIVRLNAANFSQDHADAARSLLYLFGHSTRDQVQIPAETIAAIAGRTPRSKAEKEARFLLLKALYDAGWTSEYGLGPSYLWGQLVEELAERGDLHRALEVMEHVDSPRVIVQLSVDKRFDALRRQAPARFDIAGAGERWVANWGGAVRRFPHKLNPIVQLSSALLNVGQCADAYKITHAVLSVVDRENFRRMFDDDETALNWILDTDARVLECLQDWKDAEWDLRSAADRLEHGQRNVSNVINLADFEDRLGRPDDALRVLAELPMSDAEIAPYGRMQWYDAQLAAAVAKGDNLLASSSLAYMTAHRSDAPSTYQWALLRVNHLDEAAQLLIRRLADPISRSEALVDVQRYQDPPPTPAEKVLRDRMGKLLERQDVRQEIDRVGRVIDVPLPSPES